MEPVQNRTARIQELDNGRMLDPGAAGEADINDPTVAAKLERGELGLRSQSSRSSRGGRRRSRGQSSSQSDEDAGNSVENVTASQGESSGEEPSS